jgi:hypothetical protein
LAVTEPQRLALHAAARAALGAEEGDTLMALTPPANTEMATRQDLERVEERLGARIDGVEERLGARIDLAISDASATLTRSQHFAEVRTIGIIVLAVLGTNFLG